MMHPEVVEERRPGSSDDDWSVVDDPEVQQNQVAGKSLLPLVSVLVMYPVATKCLPCLFI